MNCSILFLCAAAMLSPAAATAGVPPEKTPIAAAPNDPRRDATVAALEKVMPSVVNIATENVIEYRDWYEEVFRGFYGRPRQPSLSLGSGVIVDEEGFVLTNFHVVRRASRVQVKLWDGREYEADPIVATEHSDVALIKIRAKPGDKFREARFAAPDDLILGETVLALGNPYGLGGSVTRGILSSKNRRPSTGNEPLNMEDWLQTDASINPGNSGGPLVNLRGEIIGLNVAVYREQEGARGMGVGFSIPIRQVGVALSQFFTPEVTDSLWFGARFSSEPGPLLVSAVVAGSPAAQAGLAEGDVVQQVNGVVPADLIKLNKLLVTSPARELRLDVKRRSDARSVKVKLTPFPDMVRQKLGLTLLTADSAEAQRAGLRAGSGLLIKAVESGSPSEKAGLEPGMIVSGINREASPDLRHFGERLSRVPPGDDVLLSAIVTRRVANRVYRQEAAVGVKTR